MAKRLTKIEFINKAREVHGDKYDYSQVEYVNNHSKVKIECPEHGFFKQEAASHLRGSECPICGQQKTGRSAMSKEEFIFKAMQRHGERYDYSLVNYINNHTKVQIRCLQHGIFEQTPQHHLRGIGCPTCAQTHKQNTVSTHYNTEWFIAKAKERHGDIYDYSVTEYVNRRTKVKIRCLKHGIFEQLAGNHLNGQGCPQCGVEKQRLTTEYFIEQAKQVHGDKYDYSLVEYINAFAKVKIRCVRHGVFEQFPGNHLQGDGCPQCGIMARSDTHRLDTATFIKKARQVHGDRYDYSLTKYVNTFDPVEIICLEHGVFKQRPHAHLSGSGCPICKASRGEMIIKQLLEQHNTWFKTQVSFTDLKHKHKLRFDFVLYEANDPLGIVEYNGEQHYEPIDYFGGEENFKTQQERDSLKRQWAAEHNIPMLEIPYWEYDNIETLVTNFCKEIGALDQLP